MLSSGNSEVGACSHNLLSAMQREIPFARAKGIDPDVYDVPFGEVETVDLEFGQEGDGDATRYTVEVVETDDEDEDDEEDDE